MTRAIIRFGCLTAGCRGVLEESVEVSGPNLLAERASDGDAFDEHQLSCPVCQADYIVETVNGFVGVSASLMPGGESVSVHLDHSEDVTFDDFEPARDPLAEYEKAALGLSGLLNERQAPPDGILYRMIFSQFIASMEAYLTDKLLLLCSEWPEIQQRVVDKANIFKDATIPLAEAVKDRSAPQRRFRAALQAVLYHDLDRVKHLYQIALQGRVFPNDEAETALRAAVALRHDCVHRNGMTKDGELNTFPPSYILDVAAAIEALVRQIEASAGKTTTAICASRPF